jgi:hypothetical protein
MPPAESYVVSSTSPESIDFTHRFPRRSMIFSVIPANSVVSNSSVIPGSISTPSVRK